MIKLQEAGRSMIEMLGVLAIGGILSVGGISGFSKAMMKHKLIIQTEFFNNIFATMELYKQKFRGYPFISLIPVFQTMGVISPEIRTSGSGVSIWAYDNLGNQFRLNTNDCTNNICRGTVFSYSMTSAII